MSGPRKRMGFLAFLGALDALRRPADRDMAAAVLMMSVPRWLQRLGGRRGPYMRIARRLQRRWWGPEHVR